MGDIFLLWVFIMMRRQLGLFVLLFSAILTLHGQSVPPNRPIAGSWSSHLVPGRPGQPPTSDAALAGTASVKDKPQVHASSFLFVGCDSIKGVKTPVIRFTVADVLGLSLDGATTTPGPELDDSPDASPAFVLKLDGFVGNRNVYQTGTKGRTYTMLQFSADPREAGRFASPDIAGKTLTLTQGNAEIAFNLPAPAPILTSALASCGVAPWSPSTAPGTALSEGFRKDAIKWVQDIAITRFKPKEDYPLMNDNEDVGNFTLTEAEDEANRFIQGFSQSSIEEKTILPRRTLCAKALTAALKAGPFQAPAACKYVKPATYGQ